MTGVRGERRLTAMPFDWVTARGRPRLLASLTVLLVGTSTWLFWMGGELVTGAAPDGIVSFELAGTSAASGEILSAWSQRARSTAMLIQGVDYLYLLVYPAWFSLAAVSLTAQMGATWRRAGSATSWIVLGAAPLDAVENYALIQQLLHGPTGLHSGLAWWCAVPKFALVIFAAGFLVLAGGAWLARLRRT